MLRVDPEEVPPDEPIPKDSIEWAVKYHEPTGECGSQDKELTSNQDAEKLAAESSELQQISERNAQESLDDYR